MAKYNSLAKAVAVVASLKVCSKQKDLCTGCKLHSDIIHSGLLNENTFVANALVSMYAKCGAIVKAWQVFDELPVRDVVSWTVLIQHADPKQALDYFEQMHREGLDPNVVTFACILKACGSMGANQKGEEVHARVVREGLLGKSSILGTALLDMYSKCGALVKACQVFDELQVRDLVSWNALIAGYAQHRHSEHALNCFTQMQSEGLTPNVATFSCILKACGNLGAVKSGEEIHDRIVRQGLLGENGMLGTALVDMYVKFGALSRAFEVFEGLPVHHLLSWTAIISGYTDLGCSEDALNCFEQMQGEGFSPDELTFSYLLRACGGIGAIQKGEELHAKIVQEGMLGQSNLLGSALVEMYAKCCKFEKARQVFDGLCVRDVVLWNVLITGYAQHELGEAVLHCFQQMQSEGLSPEAVTFTCLLKACGSMGAAEKGEEIHSEVSRERLLGNDIVLGNALVDMYAKCGELAKAQEVFDELPLRDVVSWNALIGGYAQQGHVEKALHCFEQMQDKEFCPNEVTFTCMVDLLGRAGLFEKAMAVIKKISSFQYPSVWLALLNACQMWGNVTLGRVAFEHAALSDEKSAAAYVHMSSIYALAGLHEEADKIEAMRIKTEAWKKPAHCWWTDMAGNIHVFSPGDVSHTSCEDIYTKLYDIAQKLLQEGYALFPKFTFGCTDHIQ